MCVHITDNTAQNSSDNFLSYPPDNHHSSDAYWREGGTFTENIFLCIKKGIMAFVNYILYKSTFHMTSK